MAYKRYIKRGGKVYGPYFQHNKKVGGKVVTKYLGKRKKKSSVNLKKGLFAVGIIGLAGLVALFLMFIINLNLTGNASLDIQSRYVEGELLKGNLKFNLKQGELIPLDSKIIIELGDETQEFFLSEFVDTSAGTSAELAEGDFYAENTNLFGAGQGYGLIGEKRIYPVVNFEMSIFDVEEKEMPKKELEEIVEEKPETTEEETEEVGSEDIEEEPETGESDEEEIKEEIKEVETEEIVGEQEAESVDEKIGSEKEQEVEESEPEEESSFITGDVVSELKTIISGSASKEKKFEYDLEKDQGAEIVEGSVKVEGEIVEENVVDVKLKKEKVVVSTDYFYEEQGFGEDYLGNKELKLEIEIGQLNLTAQEGELAVSLIYDDMEIASVSKKISVEKIEEVDKNITEIIKPNVTIVNETITNVTVDNLTIETTQYGAVLNKPVKWKKNIKLDGEGIVKIEIPKQAENITVYKIIDSGGLGVGGEEVEEIEVVNKTLIELNKTKVKQESAEVNQTKETFIINKSSEAVSREFKKEEITAKIITGKVSLDVRLDKEKSFVINFFKKIFSFMTGRVVDVEETEEIKEVIIEEDGIEFVIEYETPGPTATESPLGDDPGGPQTSYGKEIVISSEVHYENILVYTELPMEVSESVVKLYHIVNGTRVLVNFKGYSFNETFENKTLAGNFSESLEDKSTENKTILTITGQAISEGDLLINNSNQPKSINKSLEIEEINKTAEVINKSPVKNQTRESSEKLINYIEWVVPHLSNQTYQLIIEITKAEHLDENRSFIEDVYEEVKAKDDNWTEIPEGHYVRVTFEQNLTSDRDITIYARSSCAVGNGFVVINDMQIPCDIYQKKKRIEEIRRELDG